MDDATRRSLVETAWEEADRLNRLVGNLLDMTRIEAGAMKAHREPGDVQDVIGAALERLDSRLGDHQITVNVPADLPLVPMDFVLIVHVLVNVIDNALRYSPAGSPVEIRARAAGDRVEIEVADRGIGIPPEDLARVFDKFYRVQRPDSVTGTGLGLSISKGIVEVHGGAIWAQNRPGGGTVITLALPLGEPGPTGAGESR
jgi:two-component system sensor histidine kinase KdpD